MRVPTFLLRQQAVFTPVTQTGRGTVDGAPVTVRCRAERRTGRVVTPDGWALSTETQLVCDPLDAAGVAPGWRCAVPIAGGGTVDRVVRDVTIVTGPYGEPVAVEVVFQ